MDHFQEHYTVAASKSQATSVKKLAQEWQLTVDKDLHDLLVFPGDEQRIKMLEGQIVEEGCRDPLVVWRETGIIVDGNTRYDICLRNNIPFAVVFMHFDNKSGAMQWAKDNQSNRRNMTIPQSIEVMHKIEYQIKADAEKRMLAGKKQDPVPNLAQGSATGRSRDKLADMAGVGHTTYQKGTHILDNAPEPIKQAWKSEALSTDAAYQATKLPEEIQRKIIDEAERGENPIKQIVNDAIRAEKEGEKCDMQEAARAFSSGEAYNLDNLVDEVIENGEDCVDAIRVHIETRITLFSEASGRIAEAIDRIIKAFSDLKEEVTSKWN